MRYASPPMEVSVVVATYNRARLLHTLLEDLAAQTLASDRFDLVLVDDGSREPVRPFVEKLSLPYRVQLIEQPNAGQASARDRGIRAATGRVVVIVDDDMALVPGFLEAHLRAHDGGADVVMGLIEPPPGAKLPLFEKFHADALLRFAHDVAQGRRQARGVNLATGNVSFFRDDYLAIGGFDRTLKRSEDRELGIRLERAGKRLTVSEEAKVVHHSDHASEDGWHKRSFEYGVFDLRIARKHPGEESANPWSYLWLVHPVSRPLLIGAALAPDSAKGVARLAMRVARRLERMGYERAAIRGCTFAFGVEYFRGVRTESGSLLRMTRDLVAYAGSRRHAAQVLRRSTQP